MKKILLAIICLGMAYTSWSQKNSDFLFSMDVGLGMPSEAAKEVADPSNAGTFVLSFAAHKSAMKVFKNTTALVGVQFTHIGMTHDDKHSPADFGAVTHDLETNTSLLAPTLRFETAMGNFYPFVEAGAGLMTQRSNIVTTSEDEASGFSGCTNSDVTRTKINDMQTQLGLQSSVGLSYGQDNWRINLSANFVKGTSSFLMPEKNLKESINFDDVGEHYLWQSVRPEIMTIKLGVTMSLGSCYAN